ncbi:MAG: hypothetical protein PVH29_00860 [Candidatus Zixiibacteriota bacterium]|jgi:hypothetical protein
MSRKWLTFGLIYLSVIPVIAAGSSGSWAPKIIGQKNYDMIANGPAGIVIMAVCIALPFVASIGHFIKPMMSFFGGSPKTRRILKYGRPAQAIVRSIGESSLGGTTTVNDQPYLGLTLEVDDGYQAPYLVQVDTIIPRSLIPQFQPGAVIPVKVDPKDPQEVRIDWN